MCILRIMSCLASRRSRGDFVRAPDLASESMSAHFEALERDGEESHFFCSAARRVGSGEEIEQVCGFLLACPGVLLGEDGGLEVQFEDVETAFEVWVQRPPCIDFLATLVPTLQ